MLGDISVAENIYIACGYTDMHKSIDGLSTIVHQRFYLDPFSNSLFLFYGSNSDGLWKVFKLNKSNLIEMILLLRKEKFGSSSEKTGTQIEG